MQVSQKCQYALRSVYELARRWGQGPRTIREIAHEQDIPARFLELILADLRRGGFVESRRGKHGGYLLSLPPDRITIGQIVRLIDGPIQAADDDNGNDPVFSHVWHQAAQAVADVYDATTFRSLLEHPGGKTPLNYSI